METKLTINKAIVSICIQDLSVYNNGFLVFEWVNLPIDEDELQCVIDRIYAKGEELCKEANHEEFMLADYESDCLDINEWSDPFLLNAMAQELSDLSEQDLKKYAYLVKQSGYDHDGAMRKLDDCDIYENMSMEELAEQFLDEGLFGTIPDNIINYIDISKLARDLSMDYDEWKGDIFRAA